MSGYRCPLGSIQPVPVDAEGLKRGAWRDDGILVVLMNDPRLNWMERQVIQQVGEKLFGARKQGARS